MQVMEYVRSRVVFRLSFVIGLPLLLLFSIFFQLLLLTVLSQFHIITEAAARHPDKVAECLVESVILQLSAAQPDLSVTHQLPA